MIADRTEAVFLQPGTDDANGLPVQESAGRYSVRLIPVKGREDQVKQVLIIAEVV